MKRIERYADMPDEVLEAFEKAVEKLFPQDCDGDRPVDYTILDRRKYQPMHWFCVPYEFLDDEQAETLSEQEKADRQEDIEQLLVGNVAIAVEALESFMKMKRFHIHEVREKRKPIEEQIKNACPECRKGVGFEKENCHPDPTYPPSLHMGGKFCHARKLRIQLYLARKKSTSTS
jgi:hypothetical protein